MKKALLISNITNKFTNFIIPSIEVLKGLGYEVHSCANYSNFIDDKSKYDIEMHHIDFYRNPFNIRNIKAYKQLLKLMKDEKFDVVHCNTPIGGLLGRICAKKTKVPKVIYTAHGFHFYNGAPLINRIIYRNVEKWLAKYTDILITMNDEDYENAKKFKLKKNGNTELIHGVGVNTEEFNLKNFDRDKYRERLDLNKENIMIISTGDLIKRKNYEASIKAIANCNNKKIQYFICGEGPLKSNLENLALHLGVSQQVHFLGFRSDIKELLNCADIFLFTTLQEGLPRSLMEAMASGLPCVVSKIRGNVDLINTNGGYLIKANDIYEISKDINILANNKELRLKFGENNKDFIKLFDVKYVKQKLMDIYKNIDTSKKRRVLHLLTSTKYGGAENVVCQIIKMFNSDMDMLYCSPTGDIEHILNENNIKHELLRKVSIIELNKIVNKYKPDIIHAHDVKASILASFFKRKATIISHIHGNHNSMNKINIKTVLYAISSAKYKHIFWVSKSALRDYRFFNYVKNKSSVLYNVIDKKEIIEKINRDMDTYEYDIIFLGRLTYPKNPERLMDILKIICEIKNNTKIAIVGTGDLEAKVEEKIIKYQLQNNVFLLGFKDNPYKILKSSKVMLMCSIYEGTPMCALEAMLLGIPIVSTPTDGLVDLIEINETGYTAENNEKLARYCIEIINNIKLRNKLSNNSKNKFDEINNIVQYKKNILDKYEE